MKTGIRSTDEVVEFLISIRPIAVLTLAYFVAGTLARQLALTPSDMAVIWPSSGIALAALLLWGYRLWPGVFFGSFLVHVTISDSITFNWALASIGIATGSTLEALLGAYLVNRFAGGRRVMEHAQDILVWAIFSALVSPMVSATVGIASLWLAGLVPPLADVVGMWVARWDSAAVGNLVAPAVILWARDRRWQWSRARSLEAGLVLLLLCVFVFLAFGTAFRYDPPHLGWQFLCIPPLLWLALRFEPREVATAIVPLSGLTIWVAMHGLHTDLFWRREILQNLQTFLGIASVTALSVAAEVSRRWQREQELEVQAETLRRHSRLLDQTNVLALDMDHRIILWSKGSEQLYGFKAEEAIGKVSHSLLQTVFPEPLDQIRAQLLQEREWKGELRHRPKDGSEVIVASHWSLYRDGQGRPLAILEDIVDVTHSKSLEEDIIDRKRVERELQASREALQLAQVRLHALTADLIFDGEQVRADISRELHDGFTQNLAALAYGLAALAKKIPESARSVREDLDAMRSETQDLLEQIRHFSHNLHPAFLEDFGLVPALKDQCMVFSKGREISVRFSHRNVPKALSPQVSLSLYRIVQEGLRNIGQHAIGARKVKVTLIGAETSVFLRIRDDGLGFDPQHVKGKKGLGLISMSERARALGGRWSITPQSNKGVLVEVAIPLRQTDDVNGILKGQQMDAT